MNENTEQSLHLPAGVAFEQHYTVRQIAELWGLATDVVRRLFASEPDVIKLGHAESLHKRGYVTLKIPATVVERVHRRLQVKPGKPN